MKKFSLTLMALFVVLLLTSFAIITEAKLKTGECEVCLKALTEFKDSQEKKDLKNDDVIDENLRSWCANQRGKNERLCYYIGGSKTSATKMLKDVSIPLKNGLPPERICEKLKKSNPAIWYVLLFTCSSFIYLICALRTWCQ